MTDPENPYFAQVMVNRVWAELMGRGLVEPVDDLRATNPATNQPLLDYLAGDFRDHGYDVKHLIRRITTSEVFALGAAPSERNLADLDNFSPLLPAQAAGGSAARRSERRARRRGRLRRSAARHSGDATLDAPFVVALFRRLWQA